MAYVKRLCKSVIARRVHSDFLSRVRGQTQSQDVEVQSQDSIEIAPFWSQCDKKNDSIDVDDRCENIGKDQQNSVDIEKKLEDSVVVEEKKKKQVRFDLHEKKNSSSEVCQEKTVEVTIVDNGNSFLKLLQF